MPIGVFCKTCEKTIRVRDDLAGKRIKCPGCGQVLAVPAGAGSTRATAPGAAEDAIEQARPWTGSAAKPLHEELPSAPEDEDDPTPRKSKKKRRPPAPTFVSANRWWFVGGGAGTVFLVALVIVLVVVAGRDPAPPAPGPQVALAEPQPAPAQASETTKASDAGAVKSPFALPEPSVNPPAPQPMPEVAPPKAPQKGPIEKGPVEKPPVEKPPVDDAKAPPSRPPNSFGAIVRELTGHTKKVTALAFLPGGKRALTGSGFAETSPGVVAFGVLIPGSTEIHVTVNRKLGYTIVADLRFLDDAVVDLLVNGMVQVNQAGIRARHATGVLYVSQAIDIDGRKAFVMAKQGPAAGK